MLTGKDNTIEVLRRRHREYRGMASRVAKKLGCSHSIVARVAKGKQRSRRIESALVQEMRRIEREIERTIGQAA